MTTHSNDPFQPQGMMEENARIDYIGFSQLSENYVQSADALIDQSLENSSILDVHVYAICFLYRHGLELALKDIAWKSYYCIHRVKRFAKSDWQELGRHGLSNIWLKAYPDVRTVLAHNWPLPPRAEDQINQLLLQIERHDPDSYSFRYPIGKKKNRTLKDLKQVNIRVLKDRMREVMEHLMILIECLDWCCENLDE